MATLWVTEFSGAVRGGQVPIAHGRKLRNNNVAIGSTSAVSQPFGINCGIIRLATDTGCSYVLSANDGVSPTATTADQYLPAGSIEYVSGKPGDYIAVIQNP